ncbi:hypothetical protein LK994_09220 [Ferruginibacter lapsinanis]|uniref:hypothetical protein n=1 Tax=Ferruginibacter lapsinanis TaxID=563172 RepID=UPI001E588B54|nr:hypothetical protein [Ferruginibacter lapsinanis]UEG48816.1 hypothetical protein LK994_09220 [Ferruginibacter lapsinanis]
MPIQYIVQDDIDKQKWDNCISTVENGNIYAYAHYLDAMSKHWDALVLNDYEAVMPLPWNKKYTIHYLYQPFFCAALGVFGNNLSAALVNDFLHAIPKKFKFWDIYLNHGNYFSLPDFNLYQRKNLVLPLHNTYENIFAAFRDNIKRNIRKSESVRCEVQKNIHIDEVIALAKMQAKNFSPVTNDAFDRFKKLYTYLAAQGKAITYGAYLGNHELVASCAFFFSHNRAYYILVGNHPNGKTIGASHAVINAFIKDNAGKNILLDFEGSDIEKVAFFYSGFGAAEEKYAGLKLNRLPFWAKWLKK